MFGGFDSQTRQLLIGNLMLIFCCVFYLIWWLIAFKPEGAIKGMRSGWLLIPAFVLGIIAIIEMVIGSNMGGAARRLMPTAVILIGGLAAYVILLIVSWILLKRPVTTELLLIVGWTVLAYLEINALYGTERFGRPLAITFLIVAAAAAAIGIVCYLLYYGLDARAGYIDGTVPLLLIAGVMAVLTARILI